MKSLQILSLAIFAILFSSCRSSQLKAPIVFDPLSLGSAGPTLKKYLERNEGVAKRTQSMVSLVKIEASLPNLEKKGEMMAAKTTAPNGHISYEMKSFTGDNLIKTKVIGLYLSAEQEASEGVTPAITAQNYRFKFKRKDSFGDRMALIFELTPLKKVIGLFKGELWLEENSGLELRQSGRLVKNPSVIFKTADFSRDFETRDGVTYLSKVDYQAETRVIGKATLKMEFEPPKPAAETIPQLNPSHF